MTEFWKSLDAMLVELREAKSVDAVLAICVQIPGVSTGHGFWEGGYDEFADALSEAGWRTTWSEAPYYWVKQAPDGSKLRYIEGDLYREES